MECVEEFQRCYVFDEAHVGDSGLMWLVDDWLDEVVNFRKPKKKSGGEGTIGRLKVYALGVCTSKKK